VSESLPPLGDLNRRTAHESVTEALRLAILGGVLPTGSRLVQADLAARFGVSNTPVREAMRQLSVEGLIRFDSYRGAVVRTPTLDEVREVYEIRLLLEPVAMRKAVRKITPAELERAWSVQREMAGVADVGTWVLLNRRFHGMLSTTTDSPRLAEIIGGLEDTATSQVALSIKADSRRMHDGNAEHEQMLRALEQRDEERLVQLVRQHLTSTVQAIELLTESHE
jgi:DNA-binding GntR family transcriptional regulator